MRLRYSLQAKL